MGDGTRRRTHFSSRIGRRSALSKPGPERTSPANVEPAFITDPSDTGAWDSGPTFTIAHSDGRRFATTYQNFVHYYQPLGFAIVDAEVSIFLQANDGAPLLDNSGAYLRGA
jgi:hypothetical protein